MPLSTDIVMSVYAGTAADILMGAFGIVTIVYGAIYKDDTSCNSALIYPPSWLIVAGSVVLAVAVIDILYRILNSGKTISNFMGLILACSALFSIAWATVGGITLWRDCDSMTPHDLLIFMWIAVIAECIFAFLNLLWLLGHRLICV